MELHKEALEELGRALELERQIEEFAQFKTAIYRAMQEKLAPADQIRVYKRTAELIKERNNNEAQ